MVQALDILQKVKNEVGFGKRIQILGLGGVGICGTMLGFALYVKYLNGILEKKSRETQKQAKNFKIKVKKAKKRKMHAQFWSRIRRILKICVPKLFCKETFFLLAQLITLYLRSLASILVAKLDGKIVQAIISKNFSSFIEGLGLWMALSLPAVFINSMIRYFTGQIALCFRSRLVRYAHSKYLAKQTYYRIRNLDSRISNADQMITTDVDRMCNAISNLYTDLSKPAMDLFIYSWALYNAIGFGGPTALGVFYFLVGSTLRYSTPPFGQLAADQSALEGMFGFVHSRLIQNSEEIAFYHGEPIEHSYLSETFNNLRQHVSNVLALKVPYSVLEKFSLKYVASVLIFSINGFPVFFGDDDPAARAGTYMEQRRMLLDLANAIQRVMESYKEVMEVSGYVARVCEMLEVFEDVSSGKYEKDIASGNLPLLEKYKTMETKIITGETLKFEDCALVTPNGDVLLDSLNMDFKKDMHLIICGPNGCGKSSLFRTMGGLWPLKAGKMTVPDLKKMIWIPQNAYLSLGTLKEQIIYPDTVEDFEKKGGTIEQLEGIMEIVNLSYVVDREGGWGARQNWKDRLSGGEKQRVGMARMFYRKPAYAILDECTSQVSIDWEGKMYTHAKEIGITLITVSHRTSLHRYHTHVLKFDGEGGAELLDIKRGLSELGLADEKAKLEADHHRIESRIKEITEELKN